MTFVAEKYPEHASCPPPRVARPVARHRPGPPPPPPPASALQTSAPTSTSPHPSSLLLLLEQVLQLVGDLGHLRASGMWAHLPVLAPAPSSAGCAWVQALDTHLFRPISRCAGLGRCCPSRCCLLLSHDCCWRRRSSCTAGGLRLINLGPLGDQSRGEVQPQPSMAKHSRESAAHITNPMWSPGPLARRFTCLGSLYWPGYSSGLVASVISAL